MICKYELKDKQQMLMEEKENSGRYVKNERQARRLLCYLAKV